MALSDGDIRRCTKRLLLSRLRILCDHGFYGLLLMHMRYGIDEATETAYTDGQRIVFGMAFLDSLSDSELDFVMMHEILHVVLQHCRRGKELEPERFNIACDIVANSNILQENGGKISTISLGAYGVAMHKAPDGKEGAEYTAEQVYAMLPSQQTGRKKSGGDDGDGNSDFDTKNKTKAAACASGRAQKKQGSISPGCQWDDHSQWPEAESDESMREVWVKRVLDAAQAIAVREAVLGRRLLPLFAGRMLGQLRTAQTDWRVILNEFVQQEVADYSFNPPDRRFQDCPFFLPDFNELGDGDMPENILFMIDTSGSVSDALITAAYSEIKGAIDQFDGRLKGWLGFFDAAIIEPQPFEDEESFSVIRPAGGGGTDFQIIFEYVAQYMAGELPACIVILTDGCAPFPKEELAMGIPVLWLLNNENITPPWGRIARISV